MKTVHDLFEEAKAESIEEEDDAIRKMLKSQILSVDDSIETTEIRSADLDKSLGMSRGELVKQAYPQYGKRQ